MRTFLRRTATAVAGLVICFAVQITPAHAVPAGAQVTCVALG